MASFVVSGAPASVIAKAGLVMRNQLTRAGRATVKGQSWPGMTSHRQAHTFLPDMKSNLPDIMIRVAQGHRDIR